MLKLVIKIGIALAVVAAVALTVNAFLSIEGVTTISFGAYEITQKTSHFILMGIFGFLGIWLVAALIRRGFGGLLSVADLFSARRRTRGLDALSKALIALAENDGGRAQRQAAKAERLLSNPDLTRLVNAQAAKLAGDERRAERYYEAMAIDPDTDFLGHQGLLRQALAAKTFERALRLAERAHQMRPKDGEIIDTLFDLQRKKGDWEGARETIRAAMLAKRVTRDVADRRKAVLHVAEAMALEDENPTAALEQAMAAVKLVPGLSPAAVLAARLLAAKGETRAAQRVLIAAWRAAPHPDLAAAFASLQPNETPAERMKRFEKLFSTAPDHAESRELKAEIALSAEALPAARDALGDLTETRPTAKALALRAAIEQEDGADEPTVRGWLAKAAVAPRGAQWVCDNCGAVQKAWSPSCRRCNAFDSFDWVLAPQEDSRADDVLLPLLTPKTRPQEDGPAASTAVALNGAGAPVPQPRPFPSAAAAPAETSPPVIDQTPEAADAGSERRD